MNRKVSHQLIIMILLISLGCVGLATLFETYCISECFKTFVSNAELAEVNHLASFLEKEYAKQKNWGFLQEDSDAMWWLILRNEATRHHEVHEGIAKQPHVPGIASPHPSGWVGYDPNPPLLPLEELLKNNGPIAKPKRKPGEEERPGPLPAGPWGVPGPSRPDMIPGTRVSLPFPFPPHRMQLLSRLAVADDSGQLVWGNPAATSSTGMIKLKYGGKVVGTLRLKPNDQLSKDMQGDFLSEETLSKLVAYGLIAVVLSFIAALIVLRQFDTALRMLLEGTRKLVSGNLFNPIKLYRPDELGQIAADLNTLALTLQQQERAHKQWVADTSHELRTPIAVLRAQVEALQDGVRDANPRTLELLHGQIMTLSKLVDDLYDLAKFDTGELKYDPVPVDLVVVLQELGAVFSERFSAMNIDLQINSLNSQAPCIVNADISRLRQLFANLAENSLRYTDSGGTARVSLRHDETIAVVTFDDSPPGIPAELLPRIFERFFRVDSSRSRALGGAGIGLSIACAIAKSHGGNIVAAASDLGGLQVCVTLPLSGGRSAT